MEKSVSRKRIEEIRGTPRERYTRTGNMDRCDLLQALGERDEEITKLRAEIADLKKKARALYEDYCAEMPGSGPA